MAVNVSKIPNNNKFDPVREAILDLQGQIEDTGTSIGNGTLTINTSSPLTGTGTFTANQAGPTTINIGIDGAEYLTNITHDTVNQKLVVTYGDGTTADLSLAQYIDDTNLARLVSGTVNSTTGIATFTRDDDTTFTVDFSGFLEDDTLDSVTTRNNVTTNTISIGGADITYQDANSKIRLQSGSFADANDRYEILATGDVLMFQYWDNDQGNGTSVIRPLAHFEWGGAADNDIVLYGDVIIRNENSASPEVDVKVLDMDVNGGVVNLTNINDGTFAGDLTADTVTATTTLTVGTTNVYNNLPDGISWSDTDNRLKIGVSKNVGGTTETAIQPILLANLLTEGYIPYVASGGAGSSTINSKVSDSWLKVTTDTLELGASDPISHQIRYARFLWQAGTNDKISTVYGAKDITASIQYLGGSTTAKIEFTGGSGGGRIQFNDEYTFPATDGTSGQVLSTNGSGDLSWVAAGGPTTSDLQDVTDNGNTTTNSISIGKSSAPASGVRLDVESSQGGAPMFRLTNTNSSTNGYAEMQIYNDAGDRLIMGSIGSGYTNSAYANSAYIYDVGQDRLSIKASSKLELFSGGTSLDKISVNIESDGDVTINRGNLFTNNVYTDNTIYFDRSGSGNWENFIRSQNYPSQGYTGSTVKYWLEYNTKGGHHFVINSDGGAGDPENNFDDFTIWQGAVDGDRLLSVSNVGNTYIKGNLGVKVTSPNATLDIQGTALIGNGSSTRADRGLTLVTTNTSVFTANSDLTDASRQFTIINDADTIGAFSSMSFRVYPSTGTAMADIKLVRASASSDATLYTTINNNLGDFQDVTQATASTFQINTSLRAGSSTYDSTPNGEGFNNTLAAPVGTNNRVVNFDGNGSNPSVWWTNGNNAVGAIDGLNGTNGLAFWVNSSGGSWQRNFYIDTDKTIFERDVCVGTTSALLPSAGRGNLSVSGTADSIVTLGVNGAWSSYYYTNGSATFLASKSGTPIHLEAGGTTKLTIANNGNVGIGIGTATASEKLEVAGTGKFGDYALIGTSTTAGYYQDASNGAYRALANDGQRGYYFQSYGGGSTTMYVGLYGTYAGRVGIGTISPKNKLQVEGNIEFGNWTTAGSRYIGFSRQDTGAFGTGGASGLEIQSVVGSGLGNYDQNVHLWTHWYNNGSQRVLTATWDRKVGINDDSPSYTLDVNGTINAQNFVRVGGNSMSGTDITFYNKPSATSVNLGTLLNQYAFIDLASTNANGSWIDFSSGDGGDYDGRIRYNKSASKMEFFTVASGTPTFEVKNGSVNVNGDSTVIGNQLHINSSNYAFINLDASGANYSYVSLQKDDVTIWDIAQYNGGNLEFRPYGSGTNSIYFNHAGTGYFEQLELKGYSHKYLYINPGNGREAMVRYNGGSGSTWYVGKRISSDVVGTESFHFYSQAAGQTVAGIDTAGNGRFRGDVIAYYSDMRLKTKIGDIENPIAKVQALNGFYYEPNEVAQSYGYEKERRIGLSAQDVKEVVPEAIHDAPVGDGYMSVDYAKLVPVLVEAIKEQQKQIDELKARLDA